MTPGTITSRAAVRPALIKLIELLNKDEIAAFSIAIEKQLLKKKIKFPILEFAAEALFDHIPSSQLFAITDEIISKKTMGGNTLVGKLLQLAVAKKFTVSLKKAEEYIIAGNEWYVCDIIGERVMGHALLIMPEKTLPVLKKYRNHSNTWMARCIGVAAHYAVKKGLKKVYVDELFVLLLSMADATEFHTRKGVGWAVKTTAKFHPDIIKKHKTAIDKPEVKTWFRSKITIGLGRTSKYASRYTR